MGQQRRRRVFTRVLLLGLATSVLAAFAVPAQAAPLLPIPKKPLNPLLVSVDNIKASVAELQKQVPIIQAEIETAAADLQAEVDRIVAEGQADPTTIAENIQALPDSDAIGGVQGQALSLALSLASKVAKPVCSVIGAAAAETSGVSVPMSPDYSLFGPLAPVVREYNRTGQSTLDDYYLQAYAQLLSPVALPAPLDAANGYVALAQALLTLIKTNWETTYYPADGSAAVVKVTPGFLFLPSLLDIDGNLGYDACANMGFDLGSGAINQQIDRIPGADPKMRADIKGKLLLDIVSVGYEVPAGSFIPSMYQTDHTITGAPFATKVNLPGPTLNQVLGLTTAIAIRIETGKTPESYSLKSATPGKTATEAGSGTQINWKSNQYGGFFNYETKLGSLLLGVGANPAPGSFEYCTSSKGFCSNDPDTAIDTSSMHFVSSAATTALQYGSAATKVSPTCASTAILGEAKLRGSKFYYGSKAASTSAPGGKVWLDTDDAEVTGCLAAVSTTATLPPGFKAQNRKVTWVNQSTGTAPAATKTGAINCPAGTAVTGGTLGIGFGLSRYACVFAPANTVAPAITGQNYQASELTVSNGTWTPSAPNAPTFSYIWERCDSACSNIAGANTNKYTLTPADLGKTVKATVVATNLDGTASATSAPSGSVTLPPAPINTVIPSIGGLLGSGKQLTAAKGTWINAPVDFAYEWLACDANGENCSVVGTGTTYTPTAEDEGRFVSVKVTASNIGGEGVASSDPVRVPQKPVNTGLPAIINGSTPAAAVNVFHGDTVKVSNGVWADVETFSYQWLRCDAAGENCAAIDGETGSTYKAASDDIGSVIGLAVTGHNNNLAPNDATTVNALVTGLVLANSLLPKDIHNVPDGTVYASAPSDHNSAYLGGAFDTVGKVSGKGGAVGITATPVDGQYPVSLPAKIKGGVVKASISDLGGGFIIGGSFTSVGGVTCPAIARVLADGSVDTAWCGLGGIAGEVRALNRMATNGSIGVGGLFTANDGHRNFLVVDPTQGAPLAVFSDADPDGPVNAITNNPGTVNTFFVGGSFANAGTTATNNMAAYATNTATAPVVAVTKTTWQAGVCSNTASPCVGTGAEVRTLFWSTLGVFTGGKFAGAYGNTTSGAGPVGIRNNAADMSAGTSGLLGWNPNANGPVNAITGVSNFGGSTATGSGGPYTVYLGGEFTKIGAAQANIPYLAAFGVTILAGSAGAGANTNAGPSSSFVPNPNGPVTSLLAGPAACTPVAPATTCAPPVPLYVGGNFTEIAGQARHRVAEIKGRAFNDTSIPTVTNWAPHAGNQVLTLSRDATNVFVGGAFNVLGGVIRKNIVDLGVDGSIGSWNPAGTEGPVNALLVKDGQVYAGGNFLRSGTTPRVNLVAFDAATGATSAWDPGASVEPGTLGGVNALASSPNGLYVGGEFNTAAGQPRQGFAEIDGSGAATALNPATEGRVFAITVRDGVVYVGGEFANFGGAARSNLAALTEADGTVAAFTGDADGIVRAIEVSPAGDVVYIGGHFGSVDGNAVGSLARLDLNGDVDVAYAPSPNASVRAIKALGSRLFVGGDFTIIGTTNRSHAAQLELDGSLTGFQPEPSGVVHALSYSPTNVLGIFGSFDTISEASTSGVGFYGA